MFDIDLIIPCYGKSELINRGLASVSTQWKKEFIHVTLVNDCSPNTDCNYQDLVDRYKDDIDIRCITMPKNSGQGLSRQFGIDNTTHDWIMFMDEDDQLGNGLAVSIIVGAVEGYGLDRNPDGTVNLDKNGNFLYLPDRKNVALVSAPLFEFDDHHTRVIESNNRIWLNSKLYNRKFLEKHNISFNEAQSRHAEDYYFMSCFFFALDNDADYMGILLDNEGLYYLWYPNEKSQSRIDPHYGYMLSGYTMDGSVNILSYMRSRRSVRQTKKTRKQYDEKLLNMTVYSYYTFQGFIRHVAETDYIPKLEQDWYILRDACKELRRLTLENFDKYSYIQKIEELFKVKNYSDVHYTEPWISFDEYITDGCSEFEFDFEQLLSCKKKYKFKDGVRIK